MIFANFSLSASRICFFVFVGRVRNFSLLFLCLLLSFPFTFCHFMFERWISLSVCLRMYAFAWVSKLCVCVGVFYSISFVICFDRWSISIIAKVLFTLRCIFSSIASTLNNVRSIIIYTSQSACLFRILIFNILIFPSPFSAEVFF